MQYSLSFDIIIIPRNEGSGKSLILSLLVNSPSACTAPYKGMDCVWTAAGVWGTAGWDAKGGMTCNYANSFCVNFFPSGGSVKIYQVSSFSSCPRDHRPPNIMNSPFSSCSLGKEQSKNCFDVESNCRTLNNASAQCVLRSAIMQLASSVLQLQPSSPI